MLPRMDTGITMAPAWPTAKSVIDVKDKVAETEIPKEYYHKTKVCCIMQIISHNCNFVYTTTNLAIYSNETS